MAASPARGPLVLVSSRAVIPQPGGGLAVSPATVAVCPASGKITSVVPAVLPRSSFPPDATYVDHSPRLLLPGLVDAHVHLNEPGRTAWEGFWTGTRAAAAGGVTTVVDMPLNAVPPTTTVAALAEKLAASRGRCWVDVGFYGGVVPGNAAHLLPLVEAGVRGFKCFLIDSGVDEFPAVTGADVALAMETLKDAATTLMFHAEKEEDVEHQQQRQRQQAGRADDADVTAYQTFLDSRPPALETAAVRDILAAAHVAPSLHLHIVHLSATQCIPLLRAARAEGVNVTAETCFHYLGFAAEDIPAGDTRHKCCPPIRDRRNRDRLWDELLAPDSCIRTVVSDHSPCTPQLKLLPPGLCPAPSPSSSSSDDDAAAAAAASSPASRQAGDFLSAWGGISSVGLGLSIMHSMAKRRGGAPAIADIVRLCCQAPAEQVGLSHRKGALRPGLDADICVFDDADVWTFSQPDMRWKNRCSPWEGHEFTGRVTETWLRGRRVFQLGGPNDGFVEPTPSGEAITERRVV
ncbi:uncharacterized protein UV8b_05786 [Ustilaginoidea virens]|uniref:Amidohydrolase-related domain-containing protein n=1 Tax=Ustilaginoidea virens TaxID=1159556 RepID=A0A8E5MIG3_USTVR|nr:uncharacterized protein UV8b_05786 [Ustilaginoidea virens]QUC21543.1 hypothetical protein UV8b_05786 [Ustilaginoidea virens]